MSTKSYIEQILDRIERESIIKGRYIEQCNQLGRLGYKEDVIKLEEEINKLNTTIRIDKETILEFLINDIS